VAKVIARIESNQRPFIRVTGRFQSARWGTKVVETDVDDEIFFAYRPPKQELSRFVRNRQPEPTNKLTVMLSRSKRGDYFLLAAYPGPAVPAEIWDERAHHRNPNPAASRKHSREFWASHAYLPEYFHYELEQ
jgi:hypothetical protein